MFSITLTKDQVKEVINCFSPASRGELISVIPEKNHVKMMMDDNGVVSVYELTIPENSEKCEMFYIKRETLKALVPVMNDDESVSITVHDNSLEVVIGGTVLHIGRVNNTIVIDNTFVPEDSKTIKLPADIIRNMARALSVVKGSSIALEPVFMIGEKTTLGSVTSYTVYNAEKTLKNVKLPTRSIFFEYFSNICRMGDIVIIERDAEDRKIRFSCGKTQYITELVGKYTDMVDQVTQFTNEANNKVYVARDKLISALKKLKLPYVGYNNPPRVSVSGENGMLKLVVVDDFNQTSTSEIKVPLQQSQDSILMSIDDMIRACEVQKEDFELRWCVDNTRRRMVFKNEDQTILISAFIEKVKQGKTLAPKQPQ